jgi:hypothetical protein
MMKREGRQLMLLAMFLVSSSPVVLGLTLSLLVGVCEAGDPPHCKKGLFPASGQTTAYPAIVEGSTSPGVSVPDDGTLQAGAALRYTDNGDGTITDLNTRLTWEKKSMDGGLHDVGNKDPWSSDGTHETIWDWVQG